MPLARFKSQGDRVDRTAKLTFSSYRLLMIDKDNVSCQEATTETHPFLRMLRGDSTFSAESTAEESLPHKETQPVRASPEKRQAGQMNKNVSIQPIQSIQKDQNSPVYSNEEDDSDEEYDAAQSLTETLRIPNAQLLGNFRGKTEVRTFRMSRKVYVPQKNEELQKSVMGLSFKLKESLQRKIEAQIKQRQPPKMFTEFFIVGVDQNKLTQADLENEIPIEPKNLFLLIDNTGNCERRQVVKDFCFPNGVQLRKLKRKRAYNILYG